MFNGHIYDFQEQFGTNESCIVPLWRWNGQRDKHAAIVDMQSIEILIVMESADAIEHSSENYNTDFSV